MDEQKTGCLVLTRVDPAHEGAIIDFLAGLFKKATPAKIRAFVRKAPTVLTRSISEQQAAKVIARLTRLGAAAEFRASPPSPAAAAPDSASPQPAASEPGGPPVAEAEAAAVPTAACSQCGRSLPEDEMLSYDGIWICAECKPTFVQKLREGEAVGGQLRYAGFWVRAGAKIIDWILLFILGFAATVLVNLLAGMVGIGRDPSSHMLTGNLVKIALAAAFATWFVGKYAATPGKMACGLKIVMPDGNRVSYARALSRYFGEWISSMILAIGYIMAAFDGEKRTLHDRICGTRVVKK